MAHSIVRGSALAAVILGVAACGGAGASLAPTSTATPESTPTPTFETRVADLDIGGRTLHLVCVGPSNTGRPTVIFEAGLGGDDRTWQAVMARLGSTDRGCAYDRAGIGPSQPAATPRTTEDQVKDLEQLLAVAGIHAPIVLVGFSLGGWNAMVYADRHPTDVVGLVLVDVRPPGASARWLAELPPETPDESEALRGNRDELTNFETDPTLNPEGLDLRASSAQAAAATFGGRPVRFIWVKDTSVFWEGLDPELAGRLDGVLLAMRTELEARAEGAKSSVVDVSHDIPEEAPDAVVDAIRQVLDEVR